MTSELRLEDPAAELETRLRDLIGEYADRDEQGEGARRFGILGVLTPAGEDGS